MAMKVVMMILEEMMAFLEVVEMTMAATLAAIMETKATMGVHLMIAWVAG